MTDFRSDIPEGLSRAVMRCLAKQPADRFQDVTDLDRALAAQENGAAIPCQDNGALLGQS
jgi:hypothetical protein